ncbi:MAG: trigger factor [Verrucomicrobia bacterium]|nr:trigger factor [Verrucomicrobiota bacterium]
MEEKSSAPVETPPQEFQGSEVKVVVHRKPSCRIELEVDTSASMAKEARQKATKLVSKEVSLPGFRKGKAPDNLVEKNYSTQIDQEWQKCLADLAFRESLKVTQLPVLNNDPKVSFNTKNISLDGAKVILFFETEPQIPVIDPKEVQLKAAPRPAVNEEKIEETVRQLRFFFASWKDISDRPIQMGDIVVLDVDVIENDPPTSLFSGVRFEVSDKSMAKWMMDLVLGKNKGDVLEGVSTPDADASQEDKEKLKPKKVRVKIHSISEATLPPFDENFARLVGAGSVEEVKTNVERILNEKADAHVKEQMRSQVSDVLLTKYPFELPWSLVDRETRFRMTELLKDPEFQTNWNNMTNEARKRTVGSVAEQSEKAVRMFYLCRKITTDAQIKISPKDLPKISDTPLDLLLGNRREMDPQGNSEVHQAEAYSRMLLEKAEDYIIAHATVA